MRRRLPRFLPRFPPRSLRGQMLAVLALVLLAAQAVSLWLFADERDLAVRAALTREALDRAANVAALVERAPPGTEAAILAAASSRLVRFRVDPAPALEVAGRVPGRLRQELVDRFGRARPVRLELHELRAMRPAVPGAPGLMPHMHPPMAFAAMELRLSVQLSDGRWLNVFSRFHRPPLQWAAADVATFGISASFLAVALWLLLGRLARPLGRLAAAADGLGRGEWVEEIPPSGPEELVRLTVAFNRMQARLRRFVEERTRLLAALGHDLRSPLTALRVRAEMVEDEETRTALIASIDEMQEMVEATLAYARGTATREPPASLDLGSFLSRLVEDYAGTDRDVTLEAAPPTGLELRLRPGATRRALRNLIDNALRYGKRARLSVEERPDELAIHIDDDGPGVPEEVLSRLFEPFVRLETSRSRETGGTGLGLAIARSLIRAQGGEVTLANRDGGGLRATVTLPRSASTAAQDILWIAKEGETP